jgi:hypothetical protein
MSKLSMSIQGEPMRPESKAVMAQVGWLGQTGEVYPLKPLPTAEQEPGSYTPLYIQIGEWELNDNYEYTIHD